MKKIYSRFRIMLMTFAISLASVFMLNGSLHSSNEISLVLPETKSGDIMEIDISEKMIFSEESRSCGIINSFGGRGSGADFRHSFDGIVTTESSCHDKTKSAKRELKMRIGEANKVLSFEELPSKNFNGKTRIVLETNIDKAVEILTYDDEKCISTIYAPQLQTALEFENIYKKNL